MTEQSKRNLTMLDFENIMACVELCNIDEGLTDSISQALKVFVTE